MTYKTAAGSPSLGGTDDRVSDQPAGSFPNRGSAGSLKVGSTLRRLDAMVRHGEVLAAAVDVASRDQLCALANRFDLNPREATSVLRILIKRRLVGAGGRVRESRAK